MRKLEATFQIVNCVPSPALLECFEWGSFALIWRSCSERRDFSLRNRFFVRRSPTFHILIVFLLFIDGFLLNFCLWRHRRNASHAQKRWGMSTWATAACATTPACAGAASWLWTAWGMRRSASSNPHPSGPSTTRTSASCGLWKTCEVRLFGAVFASRVALLDVGWWLRVNF